MWVDWSHSAAAEWSQSNWESNFSVVQDTQKMLQLNSSCTIPRPPCRKLIVWRIRRRSSLMSVLHMEMCRCQISSWRKESSRVQHSLPSNTWLNGYRRKKNAVISRHLRHFPWIFAVFNPNFYFDRLTFALSPWPFLWNKAKQREE